MYEYSYYASHKSCVVKSNNWRVLLIKLNSDFRGSNIS